MERFRAPGKAPGVQNGEGARIIPLSSARRYHDTLRLHPSSRDPLFAALSYYYKAISSYESGDIGICNLNLRRAEQKIGEVARSMHAGDYTRRLLFGTADNLHGMYMSAAVGNTALFDELNLRIMDPVNRITRWLDGQAPGRPPTPA